MLPSRSSSGDVRMRGFRDRTRVIDALAWVDRHAVPLPAENVTIEVACGRVLAERVTAAVDVPPFARSAMDGYALRGAETNGAGDYNPLPFQLIGASLPGRPFTGEVPPGSAIRIMTGAPLPVGADAVLPAEFALEAPDRVSALTSVAPGKNVGPRGEDVVAGTIVAEASRRLRPQDVGLLASVGLAEAKVIRRPRVRIIATGNELAAPGAPRGAHQIVDSNSLMLAGLVARDGGIIESQRLVADDREAIRSALVAPMAEILLVSGGSSVGVEDHAPTLVAESGTLAIHGIAMRPSSPAGMGTVGEALVFLLPGNPVSCLCAYDFFAGRAIRRLGSRSGDWPYAARSAEVSRKIVSAVGRVDYCRVRLVEGKIEPIATSGASILSSTTRADGFVIVPEECEGYPSGGVVTVYLYDGER
ncbi:MAG TPA: gephyrin-like molybdotransferase Glp [Planctomycetaceae bacterium]|nr:gephyrin-like molybdotransferase Glp [Planctomycetaceae bacterium]